MLHDMQSGPGWPNDLIKWALVQETSGLGAHIYDTGNVDVCDVILLCHVFQVLINKRFVVYF